MARYGREFKRRAVARLLPSESSSVEKISRELGVRAETLERWRAEALSEPAQERTWTAEARLETVIATAAMDESARSTWCREKGVYPSELAKWRTEAVEGAGRSCESRATPKQTRRDRRRIKELERELRRKDKALAESAAGACQGTCRLHFHAAFRF